MLTHTAERQELSQAIDALPDNSAIAILDLIKSPQPNSETDEWIDPVENGK